jgi:F-type H+-transporting ATPase subunit a
MKLFRAFFLILFLLSLQPFNVLANKEESKEGFNTVEYIFDHVNDSHEWFFLSYKDKHLAIPLPVIVYSKYSGWHVFSSSKFQNSPEWFPFSIVSENGGLDSKIIEKLPDGTEYAPLDLSITKTVLGILFASLLLIVLLLRISKKAKEAPFSPPKGAHSATEAIVLFIRDDIAIPFIGEKRYRHYLPFLLTLFSFILICNLTGLLLPLNFNITGNIAVTMVLAVFTFVITTFSTNKYYWLEIVNPEVPWFMKLPLPLIPFIEFLGVFTKPIILMIRLFANMFAGHMIVTVLIALVFLMSTLFNPIVGGATSLISVSFSLFMMLIDILVSFIQAYIFTLLSAMYFGMAKPEHKH